MRRLVIVSSLLAVAPVARASSDGGTGLVASPSMLVFDSVSPGGASGWSPVSVENCAGMPLVLETPTSDSTRFEVDASQLARNLDAGRQSAFWVRFVAPDNAGDVSMGTIQVRAAGAPTAEVATVGKVYRVMGIRGHVGCALAAPRRLPPIGAALAVALLAALLRRRPGGEA